MIAGFESSQTSHIYWYRFTNIKSFAFHVISIHGFLLDGLVSYISFFHNSDMLPAFEAKDKKTLNNPIEAYIIAEVWF